MMKKFGKQIIGICMLLALLVSAIPEAAQASTSDRRITLVYGTTDNARAGDNVSVRIVIQDNPTISTFAVAVGYDPNYLSYTSTTFSSNANNGSNIGMASDVAGDNNRRTVNVSCILGQNYQANEVIATVNFTVRQAYTTMPVTPAAREITDENYRRLTTNNITERIENGAGQTSQNPSGSQTQPSQSQSGSQTQPSQSQSGSQTQPSQSQSGSQTSQTNQPSQTSDSQSQNPSGSQPSQNPSQSGSEPTQTPSGAQPSQNPPSGGSSSTSGKKDATPKTGAFSLRFAFGGAVVLFLAVSMVCIKVLGKKKHI